MPGYEGDGLSVWRWEVADKTSKCTACGQVLRITTVNVETVRVVAAMKVAGC